MSIRNGRLYQYLLDRFKFAPLALAGAYSARGVFRAILSIRALKRPRTDGRVSADSARERLGRAFKKPELTREPALNAPYDKDIELSIIVPVYNSGEYLGECVESVYAQRTGRSYELILIDDGSDDDTRALVESYAGRERTRAYRQINKGAAAARNYALDLARGEYVMFLDADDKLAPDAIENLMSAAKREGADWVQGGWQYAHGPKQVFPRAVYEGDERIKLIELPGMPWGKVIKRELFARLRFPAGYTSYVDTPIKCLTLRMSARAATIADIVYIWRQNPKGITFTSKRTPRAIQTYWIMEQMQADSEALGLPEDDLYAAIWIRQLTCVSYDRLKGLDEAAQRDVFELSREFLAPIIDRAEAYKLPYALKLAARAFKRRDFGLWRAVAKYYQFIV